MTYRLYYTSADRPGPDAPWSVYREEYANPWADVPLGSGTLIGHFPSEQAADEEASRLQRMEPDDQNPARMIRQMRSLLSTVEYAMREEHEGAMRRSVMALNDVARQLERLVFTW